MRISDWSSDVCSSDLVARRADVDARMRARRRPRCFGFEQDAAQRRQAVAAEKGAEEQPVGAQRAPRQRERAGDIVDAVEHRSEEHTSELQSLMRISYAVFCLKKKNHYSIQTT